MAVSYCPRCGKIQYERWSEAERAIAAVAARHHEKKSGAVYRCRYCHYFHTTSFSHRWSKSYRERAKWKNRNN